MASVWDRIKAAVGRKKPIVVKIVVGGVASSQ
jgi:hypothetical protein